MTHPPNRAMLTEQNPNTPEDSPMAVSEGLVKELASTQKFFMTTLSVLCPVWVAEV